jgi:hypothetical protein
MARAAQLANASNKAARARFLKTHLEREMEVCFNFTGFDPCGEHKFSFVPYLSFTGRICTPSSLKIWPTL